MLTPQYRIYWTATVISVVGDQISVVALSWLVLRLTGDASALGSVLAVGALPRAVFVLFGGALVDRFQPIRNLMWTRAISALLLLTLAGLVISDRATLPSVLVLAASLGMVGAFSLPAGSAILPQLLAPEQLMQGNGLLIATLQLGQVLGPIAGGLLIDALPGSQPGKTIESAGIGLAFLADAGSFCLSIALLSRVKLQRPYKAQGSSGVLAQVRAGFAYVLADKALCYFITYGALVNLLILGPVTVGLPLFATQVLGGSSSTYGVLASFYGAGALTGTVASGLIPRAPARLLGPIILGCDVVIGGLLAAVTSAHSAPPACALLFGMGALGGYVMTSVFTWVQSRVPRMLIGRVISILMFSTLGLMPLSSAVAGELIARTSIQGVLGGAALCMVGAAAVAFMIGRIRSMGTEPSPQPTPAKEVAG